MDYIVIKSEFNLFRDLRGHSDFGIRSGQIELDEAEDVLCLVTVVPVDVIRREQSQFAIVVHSILQHSNNEFKYSRFFICIQSQFTASMLINSILGSTVSSR